MTRKPLPKVIRRTAEDMQRIAAHPGGQKPVPRGNAPKTLPEPAAELVIESQPPANDTVFGMAGKAAWLMKKRRFFARKIVERHRAYAAMGGLFPLPLANTAAVTAVIVRMVKQLSDLYGVPFERDRTRSAIIGLLGGAVPTGFGAVASSSLAAFLPGPGFVGIAVSAVTAGALTHGIGLVFVEHFEKEAAPLL